MSYPVGRVGGWDQLHNLTTLKPNLQVRTCKIQAKLDSKCGPIVAKTENTQNLQKKNKKLILFNICMPTKSNIRQVLSTILLQYYKYQC